MRVRTNEELRALLSDNERYIAEWKNRRDATHSNEMREVYDKRITSLERECDAIHDILSRRA